MVVPQRRASGRRREVVPYHPCEVGAVPSKVRGQGSHTVQVQGSP